MERFLVLPLLLFILRHHLGVPIMNQDTSVRGAVQTQNRDSPCPKDFTVYNPSLEQVTCPFCASVSYSYSAADLRALKVKSFEILT